MFGATFRSGRHLGTGLGLHLGPGDIKVQVNFGLHLSPGAIKVQVAGYI